MMKIAAIMTVYRPISHADVIVSRWLRPREEDRKVGWVEPRTRIVSFYIDQCPDNDMCHAASRDYGVPLFPTIREALTLGTSELAVDAVLLIGEHGEYPENELGQKLYPRKRLFDEVMDVVEESGRPIPIFFDKHLSWSFELAREMHDRIRRLNVPFFGGSSLPFCSLHPPLEVPPDADLREMVALYPASLEAYLFHGLEEAQTVLEQRRGGEQGVARVRALRDETFARVADAGEVSIDLIEAAVAAISDEALAAFRERRESTEHPVNIYRLEYADGLPLTVVHIARLLPEQKFRKFSLAARLENADGDSVRAARVELGCADDFYSHFARLCRLIETFFLTGEPPIPLDRLLLTTGATEACMQALAQPGRTLETPHLQIAYSPAAQHNEIS